VTGPGSNRVQVVQGEIEAGNRECERRGGVDRGDDRGQNFKETSELLCPCPAAFAPFCDNRGAIRLIPLKCERGPRPGRIGIYDKGGILLGI
jgi:hypothetical protein